MVLHSNFGLSKRTAFHRSPQELAIGCEGGLEAPHPSLGARLIMRAMTST